MRRFTLLAAAVPVAVLCRPNDAACMNLLRIVEAEVRLHPDDVRVVWAPWFEVAGNDAADLTLLGDAALCAEAIGSNHGKLTTSPGSSSTVDFEERRVSALPRIKTYSATRPSAPPKAPAGPLLSRSARIVNVVGRSKR